MAQHQELNRSEDVVQSAAGSDVPPPLSFQLPKKSDLPKTSKLWGDVHLPVDILLLTVEDCEFMACYACLRNSYKSYLKKLGFVYFGTIGESGEDALNIALMRCSEDACGPGGSLVTVKNAVVELRPKAVFSVGSCMGLTPEVSKLGDVMVCSKLTTKAFKPPVGRDIIHLVRHASDGWTPPLRKVKDDKVQVFCDGEIFSGMEPVSAKQQHKLSHSTEPAAFVIGGEGVFAAAHDLNIEWVIVRGISHFTNDSNAPDESWKLFASFMAASLVWSMLKDPVVFKEWPHYEDLLTKKQQLEIVEQKQLQELEQVKSGIEMLNEKLETLQTTVPKDEDLEQVKGEIKNLSKQLDVLKTTVPKDEEKNKDDLEDMKSGIEKLSRKLDTLLTSFSKNVEDPLTKRQPSAADKELRDSSCLEECQKQLRSIYETINKVKIVPWDETSAVDIDEVYTMLSWLMDDKKPSGVAQKKLEHYTDIFDGGRLHRTPKRILVHGRPGIGKTVFTQKATFDWSQHRFKGKLGRFDLVLLVKLRDVCDLQDVPAILRASKLLASDGLVSIDDLYHYVRHHQEKVLLILDGFDEYAYGANNQSPVRDIWEKNQLRDCCVVITSRDMKGEGLKNCSDAQFQVDGFDRRRQRDFARRFLKDDQDVKEFFEYLEQQELEDVAKIPLLLLMVCLVWKEKDCGGLPSSRAMVYFQFIQTLFNHMTSKEEGDAVTFRDVNEYKEDLCKIGELAFHALLQDSLYFPVNKLPNHILTTKLIKAGLFQVLNISALNPYKAVHFIHKSLQEYLASLFLNEELSSQKDKNKSLFKIDSVEKIFKMTEVFKFAVEMSEEAAREIVIHLTGMAAKEKGLTEYSFDNKSPRARDLSAEQRNYLNLCTQLLFCCSAETRKELFPTFLSSVGGVLVINPKELNVTVTENLLRTAAPLMYIFFCGNDKYTEQDYRNLITLTQQLNAVIVSCSGEMKALEFLKKYPWRSAKEFFLKKERTKTHLYFSQIMKSQNGLPFHMLNALISLVEATNKTKINPGGESSEQACSTTHGLSRVWRINAWDVNRSEVELLSDVITFVLAPQRIWIMGEYGAEYDSDMARKMLSDINRTHKLKILSLISLNVRSSAAGFIARILQQSTNLEYLDLSGNPLLGEGVDAICKHLGSTPHLRELWLHEVKMTKQQVQHLSMAVKHSSITDLVTYYHDRNGNPKPEQEWPTKEQWKRWYPHHFPYSSESVNEQEQDEGRIIAEREDNMSSFESKENEKVESQTEFKDLIELKHSAIEEDVKRNIEPEDEGSPAKSDELQKQFQTGLATELHVKPEQVSTSSPSLDTSPSSRDVGVPGSFPAGGTFLRRAFFPAAHGPNVPLSIVPRPPGMLGYLVSGPLLSPTHTDLEPPSTSPDDSVD